MNPLPRQLAPSILSFDLSDLGPPLAEMEAGGADWLHLDVMDGQFVPPITFGDTFVKAIRRRCSLPFEAHLMTETPEAHFQAFADAGCSRITIHLEATRHAHRLVQCLREMQVSPGIAINPATPAADVQPLLGLVDLVLVMTVNPGWGGQRFLPETLQKVEQIRSWCSDVHIEVDGGIVPETLALAEEAGANVFVVGNYLAQAIDRLEQIRALRGVAQ